MVILISFDIDGTLEVGDPPGILTMEMVRTVQKKEGFLIGSCSDRTMSGQRAIGEENLSWLSKCRGLLVRYDKKASNFLGLLQLACGLLWYRRVWRLTVLR